MKLIKNTKDLAKFLQLDCKTDLPIKDFQIDSRKVTKNSVFFGLNGSNVDGSIYADEAIHNLTNIEIACDLSDESVDEWGSDLAEEYRQKLKE